MRPRATFVALIVAALAGLGASRLTFDGDLAQLLPDAGPEWRETAQLLERVAVVDIEGTAEDARTFADRLDYAVRTAPTEGELLGVLDLFRDRAACFIQDYARVEARLKQIPRRIRELAQRLQEPGGFGQRAAHDPLGIGNEALLDFESFAAGFESARLDAGGVVNEKGTHRLLLVHPGFSPAETDRTAEFLADLGRAGEGLRIRHLGAHRSTRDNATTIRADATRAAILGTVAVLLIAWFVFRRPAAALLALLPGTFGILSALGALALFESRVPLAAVGFACVLLGITIDYAIHVLASRATPARAILIGATTTATAFGCLQASTLPGLRTMGALGAVGVVAAALFAIAVLRPRRGRPNLLPARGLQSGLVFWILIGTFPLVLAGWTRLRFEGDPLTLSKLSTAAARDEAGLRETWGEAFTTTTVLVRGATLEDALQANDALALENWPHAWMLPSQRTQRERIQSWRAFWTESRIGAVMTELRAATVGTPFRTDAFDPFEHWLRASPAPVALTELPRALWEDRVVESGDGWIASTPVFDADLHALPGAVVVNPRGMVTRLARLVADEMVSLGLLAAAAVALVALLWFGRPAPVAVVLVPLLAGTAWTLGLLGWLDVPITLANAAFVVFLFGLAIDYGVFLVQARLQYAATGEDGVAESDGAVVLCALTTCVGFGALLTASHPVLRSIGITALTGIASSLLFVQAIVPRLWRPQGGGTTVAALYRHQGPMLRWYAAGKAKSDPVVATLRDLAPQSSVLIAGCGYGIMAAERLLRFPEERLTGIDADPRKIRVAAGALRGFPQASFVCGDLREADLGSHELVTAVDLLHYFPEKEHQAMLGRLAAAVAPGGALLFRDGCSDRDGHQVVARWERIAIATRFTRSRAGLHFQTESGWRNLMERCGLVVETLGAGPGSNVILLCRKPNS